MVRYPDKNPPEEKKQQDQTVSAKSIPESKDERIVNDPKNEQVKELQQRVYILEKKLSEIQKQDQHQASLVQRTPRIDLNDLLKVVLQYRKILITVAVFIVVGWLVFLGWGHLYVSSSVLELKPKEFNWQGRENKLVDEDFIKLETSPDYINDLLNLGLTEIKLNQDGRYINMRAFSWGLQRSKHLAQDWQSRFIQKYVAYRRSFLVNRLNAVNTEYVQVQNQLEEVFEQMSPYKSSEEYFLVNASSKEKLVRLAQKDALDLEKQLIDIKDQLARNSKVKPLTQWSSQHKALLGTYRIKLTNIEFKKFLVGGDFANIYDEGIRTIKTLGAKLINDQARLEHIDEITVSLIIKDFFLSCRRDALEAVLDKRYVLSVDELSGRLAEYLRLKNKFEALDLELGSISFADNQIKEILKADLSKEVIVFSPLKVEKF